MRWYVVGRTRGTRDHGRVPYIEAEVADRRLTEDANDNIVTREEALADPQLAAALRDWEEGNDRLRTVGRAEWAVLEAIDPIRLAHLQHLPILGVQGIEDPREAVGRPPTVLGTLWLGEADERELGLGEVVPVTV